MFTRYILSLVFVCLLSSIPLRGEVSSSPTVQDTVAAVLQRLRSDPNKVTIDGLTAARAEALLRPEEKAVFASRHIQFRINQRALVTVFRDKSLGTEPFWLRDGSWRQRAAEFKLGDVEFDLWEKQFEPGIVGLGVNSLKGGGRHYFVALLPMDSTPLVVSGLSPAGLATTNFVDGALPWLDRTDQLRGVSAEFAGLTLVQTLNSLRDDAKLVDRLRWTKYPAGPRPDHVVLTWSGDPRTTQAVQWRTSRWTVQSTLAVIEKALANRPITAWTKRIASVRPLTSPDTVNDPVVNRHTVELAGLRPGTTYVYRIGAGQPMEWSEPREFTTAPAGPGSFTFIYMGDAQTGLDKWGKLLRSAYKSRPDAAFYIIAGDIVNRGNERDDWDDLFENAKGVLDRRPLVPVIGNHDCQGGQPRLYLEQFALPRNGPVFVQPERAYFFEYGNALFIILDSNLPPATQTAWLEDVLRRSSAKWKFVAFHHPAFSSAPNRDNKTLRELWTPIFDRYGVDLVLQGHDHAYLRTHPLRAGKPTGNPARGTTYVVSVSGAKMYRQAKHPETAVGFTDVSTWQVIEVDSAVGRLSYSAYDLRGKQRDRFKIERP